MVRCGVVPQLEGISWITVNVRSSRAQVKVRERVLKPEIISQDEPCNIVAAKTGIISKMSVLQGVAVQETGKAVLAGETIVSGAVDSIANGLRPVHAIGDIRARTMYEITAVCPENTQTKTKTGRVRHRYALVVGENRINFYSGSRNDTTGCDKIIKTYKFALEGVFTLPVSIVRETSEFYEVAEASASPQWRMKNELTAKLRESIGEEGEVIASTFTQASSGGLAVVTLRAECIENIAKAVPMTQEELEEINTHNLNLKEGKKND